MNEDTGVGAAVGDGAGSAEAKGGAGTLWLAGIAAGLGVGAVLWFMALGPMQKTTGDQAVQQGPAVTATPAPAASTSAPAAASATPEVAAPAVAEAPAAAAPVAAPSADAAATAAAPAEPPAAVVSADTATAPPAEPAQTAPAAEPAQAAPAAEPAQTAPAAEPAQAAGAADVAAPATGPAVVPLAPSFDTVRAEADGSVLVAGRGEPGAQIQILVDGKVAGTATANDAGQFVGFLSLGNSDAARVLTLQSTGRDGATTAAEASVILTPAPAPVQVAAAEPAPDAPAPTAAADAASGAEPATTTATADAVATTAEPAAGATATPESEPAAPQVLISDSKGVRRLGSGGAASVTIDTISYSDSGDVQLSGRAPASGVARFYLDNKLLGETPVGEDGNWSVTLADIAPGRYTLRVDQVGADGKVTSRFETPFQREAPEIIAAAQANATQAAAAQAAPAQPAAPQTGEAATPTASTTPAPVAAGEQSATPSAGTDATGTQASPADLPPITTVSVVTVQPGFTLWRIARENYGEGILYVKVFEANKNQIRNPDLIYPGQIFTVPKDN